MDTQYHTPPTSTVEPTVKANRRMCTRRRLIPIYFFLLCRLLASIFLCLCRLIFFFRFLTTLPICFSETYPHLLEISPR
jgi:hypothetical protein